MNNKPKIKVIKKEEIAAPAAPENIETKSKREAAREAVSTVTTWVSEFQARKRDETKAAIEKFLIQKPSTNEL